MELSFTSKRCRSALNAFCCFTFGFGATLFGQTLEDIKCLLGVELSEISNGLVLNSIFFCIGSLLCGWIYSVLNRQRLYVLQFALFAAGLAILPNLTALYQFNICHCILGFCMGGIITTMNVLDLEIWKEKSGPYIQGVQFCGALGATLASMAKDMFSFANIAESDSELCLNMGAVSYSFKAAATLAVIAASTLIFLELLEPYKTQKCHDKESKQAAKHDVNENTTGVHLPDIYYPAVILLGAAVFGAFLCVHINTGTYLSVYLKSSNEQISNSSSYLNSLFFATITIVSGASIPLAGKLKPHVMLYLCFTLVLISNFCISVFGQNETAVMVFIVMFAAGLPCTPPAVFRFIQERTTITNAIGSLYTFSSSFGPTVGMLILSGRMEVNPSYLPLFNVATILLVFTLFGVLHSTDILKFQQQKETSKIKKTM